MCFACTDVNTQKNIRGTLNDYKNILILVNYNVAIELDVEYKRKKKRRDVVRSEIFFL